MQWGRRQDWLLLAGLCVYGLGAWGELATDARLGLQPIIAAAGETDDAAGAARFLSRRLRRLETALLIEEQLRIGEEVLWGQTAAPASTAETQETPGGDVAGDTAGAPEGLTAVAGQAPVLGCYYAVQHIAARLNGLRDVVQQAYSGDLAAGALARKGMQWILIVRQPQACDCWR